MLGCVGHDATVWLSDCEWKKMGGGMLGEYMRQRGSIFLEGILADRQKERDSHDASIKFQMDQGECTRLGSGSCGKS